MIYHVLNILLRLDQSDLLIIDKVAFISFKNRLLLKYFPVIYLSLSIEVTSIIWLTSRNWTTTNSCLWSWMIISSVLEDRRRLKPNTYSCLIFSSLTLFHKIVRSICLSSSWISIWTWIIIRIRCKSVLSALNLIREGLEFVLSFRVLFCLILVLTHWFNHFWLWNLWDKTS